MAGLSLEPTRHALQLAGVELFTWCAADAVGILPGSVLSMDDVVELGRRWWDEFR